MPHSVVVIVVVVVVLVHLSVSIGSNGLGSPFPPMDSILKLMTVWRITGKNIRITIIVNYICKHVVLTGLGLACFFVFCVFAKVNLAVFLL